MSLFFKSVIDQGRYMKALTRIPIFSYNTMATTLLTDSKSLEIKFRKKYLTLESLFELETLLAWCASHPEVQSLMITAYGDDFLQGIDPEEYKASDEDKLRKFHQKLSTICQSMFCLPQTIVMDVKRGTKGLGIEFALCADIRIASPDAQFTFNQLSIGVTPCNGAFSFLSPFLNQNVLRSLLLSGVSFNLETMDLLGGHSLTTISASEMVKSIFSQSPVARLQAKRGLLGNHFTTELNPKIEVEKSLFNASLQTGDYKGSGSFMNHGEFKEKIKSTGVASDLS